MLGFYHGTPVTLAGPRTLTYAPGWLTADYAARPIRGVKLYPSFLAFCKVNEVRHAAFYRTYALGDLLMLLPVVKAVARRVGLERATVITRPKYRDELRAIEATQDLIRFAVASGRPGRRDYGAEVHVSLEAVLEADHRGGPESDEHRLSLYAMALGFDGGVPGW